MNITPTLLALLDDARFPNMSGKMRGIVRCILNREDGFAELCVTSDGHLLGRRQGDCGFNDHLGFVTDLEDNFTKLLDAAGLSDKLKADARILYRMRLGIE